MLLPKPVSCLVVQGFSHVGAETPGRHPTGSGASLPQTEAQIPNLSLLHLALQGAILLSSFATSYLKLAAAARGGSHMALISRHNSGPGPARPPLAAGSEPSLNTAALPSQSNVRQPGVVTDRAVS